MVDRVLSSATGQIRLQIDRSKEPDSTGSLITVMPLEATNPQRVTVRISGLLRETQINELALDATPSGYRGNIELPVSTAVRLQIILDNDEASSFVATLPPLD